MSVVPLYSPDGQRLKTEASERSYYQPIIDRIFKKQHNSTFCGVVSSVLAMNAYLIGKHGNDDQLPFSEANMFSLKETNSILTESVVSKEGCTLQQITDLVRAHGYLATMHPAADSSVEEFRTKAKSALSHKDSSCSVIINYDLKVIYPGQTVSGHFSPLCGYHEDSDSFLILDTWPATDECWVTSHHLFHSMNTVDTSTSKTRGYIIVSQ
ncbi:uncharacterized protein [Antedon mediterranea]|uniref:uncharacterized protein n=1 Tax=Antedon mediterranea TaxID=105859 RepID=UPI003AF9AE5E